jgi:murein DD-endopeptidase MepM/ murein hydrolase activator NlpD
MSDQAEVRTGKVIASCVGVESTNAEVSDAECLKTTAAVSPGVTSSGKPRLKSLRIPFRWLLLAGASIGVVAGLSLCLASNYLNVVVRQTRDAYVLYRLAGERDELKATKNRLEKELATVRQEQSQTSEFHTRVNTRLDELNSVVEASTALGLFKKEKKPPTIVVAKRGNPPSSPNSTSALASILDSPVLAGRGERVGRKGNSVAELRALNRGLGGAEVECRRDQRGKIVCASSVAKEDVSFRDVQASDVRASMSPHFPKASEADDLTPEQEALVERLERYTATLRALPLGSPVAGEFTSGFGRRVSPFSHRSTFHEGLDIALERGTRIRAPGNGYVVKAGYDGAYGWMVDIAHTDKVVTRYAHLSRAVVRVGQPVRRGQVIALSGSTGRSTGPHLHYEVRVNGLARNPMPFIALAAKLNKVLS